MRKYIYFYILSYSLMLRYIYFDVHTWLFGNVEMYCGVGDKCSLICMATSEPHCQKWDVTISSQEYKKEQLYGVFQYLILCEFHFVQYLGNLQLFQFHLIFMSVIFYDLMLDLCPCPVDYIKNALTRLFRLFWKT